MHQLGCNIHCFLLFIEHQGFSINELTVLYVEYSKTQVTLDWKTDSGHMWHARYDI